MKTEFVQNMWNRYPGSHLHCDVRMAGTNSYHIVMSLIDHKDNVLAMIDHFGSGDLNTLKEIATDKLWHKLMGDVAFNNG